MPAKKPNIFELHFEKAILGVAVLVFLYCLIAFVLGSPVATTLGTETVKPGEVASKVEEEAQRLENKAKTQTVPTIKGVEQAAVQTHDKISGLPNVTTLPAIVKPVIQEEYTLEFEMDQRLPQFDLPKVVTPERLRVHHARSTLSVDPQSTWANVSYGVTSVDKSWVTVAAELNIEKQEELLAPLPEEVGHDPLFIRVDLQRAEVGEDGKLGEWVDVEPINADMLVLRPDDSLKTQTFGELRNLRNQLFSGKLQDMAVNPLFPEVVAGKDWEIPLVKGEKIRKAENAPSRSERSERRTVSRGPKRPSRGGGGGMGGPGMVGGPGGGGPGRGGMEMGGMGGPGMGGPGMGMPGMGGPGMGMPGMGGPGMGGPGMGMPGMEMPGMGPRGPGGMMDQPQADIETTDTGGLRIWAHDLTAVPGKKYKYRMRAVMYNPLAGWPLYLKEKSATLQAALTSDWSEPSEAIKIQRDMYYFVTGARDDGDVAQFEIYKWHTGWLCREKFNVAPNEPIGELEKTKFYLRDGEARLIDSVEDVNFSIGAVLVSINANAEVEVVENPGEEDEERRTELGVVEVVIRTDDGETIKQDAANAKLSEDYKLCKELIREQLLEVKTKEIVKAR